MKMNLTRQEQKIKTKQNLVFASIDLFSKNGIMATKTVDIAKAIGVSHGTVFVHFPTKNDLLIEVIDEVGRKMASEFREFGKKELNVKQVLKSHLKVLEKYEDFYTHLLLDGPNLPGEVRGTLITLQAGISCYIKSSVKKEEKTGKIRSLPSHLLFNTWMGLITYYLINRDLFAPDKSVIKAKGDEILNHFLKLIKT
ncbi:MAG: TetR/AcrR family transcriptional regulator [Bacteriovoracaceae bacterium]|nr:TetR/AcrR family transcriptional regulator [Bacteriovoracaceae bacterium]